MKIHFLNYHYDSVSVHARPEPLVLYGEGDADDPALTPRSLDDAANAMRGAPVLFLTHGFNVSYVDGLRSLARFAARLALPDGAVVVGVLWPGDFHSLGVNYPAASVGAIDAGRSLGDLCNTRFAAAASVSFMSHSLGARVILEAAARLTQKRPALLCLAAGAVNDDCLTGQYAQAARNAVITRNIASNKDMVLKVLFRIGDPLSQLLDNLPGQLGTDDHSLFEPAIGQHGPLPYPSPPVYAAQIGDAEGYGHGNYLAPPQTGYAAPPPSAPPDKWFKVAAFVSTAFGGNTPAWPPPAPPPRNRAWSAPFEQWRWPLA